MAELTFEAVTHTYRLDGKEIPSVSKILEPLSRLAYGDVNQYVLNMAAARGTDVHEAIEDYNLFGEYRISDEYEGYMQAYLKWYSLRNPEVIKTEVRIYHSLLMYAGTADLICRSGEDICLVDYKTSSKVLDKIYRVQLEAYRQALERFGFSITRKLVLHLKNDGSFEEVLYPVSDMEAWRVFGSLKTIYDYTR